MRLAATAAGVSATAGPDWRRPRRCRLRVERVGRQDPDAAGRQVFGHTLPDSAQGLGVHAAEDRHEQENE